MSTPLFITGIGTGVGKTLAAAVVAEALGAAYWKPVQAGRDEGRYPTDSAWVEAHLSNPLIHPEGYFLDLAASPHIAARQQGVRVDLEHLVAVYRAGAGDRMHTVIEGAGGLLVPLNERDFMCDLALALKARVIVVSRHYLGSINHSLLTAEVCRSRGLDVLGWIFNDRYMDYEDEIVRWSGYPRLGSIPFADDTGPEFVHAQAEIMRPNLLKFLEG